MVEANSTIPLKSKHQVATISEEHLDRVKPCTRCPLRVRANGPPLSTAKRDKLMAGNIPSQGMMVDVLSPPESPFTGNQSWVNSPTTVSLVDMENFAIASPNQPDLFTMANEDRIDLAVYCTSMTSVQPGDELNTPIIELPKEPCFEISRFNFADNPWRTIDPKDVLLPEKRGILPINENGDVTVKFTAEDIAIDNEVTVKDEGYEAEDEVKGFELRSVVSAIDNEVTVKDECYEAEDEVKGFELRSVVSVSSESGENITMPVMNDFVLKDSVVVNEVQSPAMDIPGELFSDDFNLIDYLLGNSSVITSSTDLSDVTVENNNVTAEESSDVDREKLHVVIKRVQGTHNFNVVRKLPQRAASRRMVEVIKEEMSSDFEDSDNQISHTPIRKRKSSSCVESSLPMKREVFSSDDSPTTSGGYKYRKLRDKNNAASRRSRENRKLREREMTDQCQILEKENMKLKVRAEELENLVRTLRDALITAVASQKKS